MCVCVCVCVAMVKNKNNTLLPNNISPNRSKHECLEALSISAMAVQRKWISKLFTMTRDRPKSEDSGIDDIQKPKKKTVRWFRSRSDSPGPNAKATVGSKITDGAVANLSESKQTSAPKTEIHNLRGHKPGSVEKTGKSFTRHCVQASS